MADGEQNALVVQGPRSLAEVGAGPRSIPMQVTKLDAKGMTPLKFAGVVALSFSISVALILMAVHASESVLNVVVPAVLIGGVIAVAALVVFAWSRLRRRFTVGQLAGSMLALLFGVPFVGSLINQASPNDEAYYRNKMCHGDNADDYAFAEAKIVVKEHLRAPSTATFPSWLGDGGKVRREGECTFVVSGWVDAQNGFGAMIRSDWEEKVIYDHRESDGYDWKVGTPLIEAR